jgi:hypothetical protein
MLAHPGIRGKMPLSTRICRYLASVEGRALHYRTIAERLHADPGRVGHTLHYLAKQGRAKWVDFGVYRLAP